MERKIRILTVFIIFLVPLGNNFANAQGLVPISNYNKSDNFVGIDALHNKANDKLNYVTINLSPDSLILLPAYAFKYSGAVHDYVTNQELPTTHNREVVNLAKNYPMGNILHYVYAKEFLFVLSPQTGYLIVKNRNNKHIQKLQISSKPFGLCYSSIRNELYVSKLKSRYIHIISLQNYNKTDSILLNGNSARYLALSNLEDKLYVGVHSANSISKIDLDKRKLENFVKTGNISGPLKIDAFHNIYCLEINNNVLSKFDAKTLRHYESVKLNFSPSEILFTDSTNSITLFNGSNAFVFRDTLFKSAGYYFTSALDSVGRYTWIINSYTNPKWALAKKMEFEKMGIKSYISCQTDGYYRLCAGLYKNQEEAVRQKSEHIALFSASWLLSIHPHKF